MSILKLPVRWYSNTTEYNTLEIEVSQTAFMIVDSDCDSSNTYVEKGIAPALATARKVKMHVIFIHNDFSLVENLINPITLRLFNHYYMNQISLNGNGPVFIKLMLIIICDVITSKP